MMALDSIFLTLPVQLLILYILIQTKENMRGLGMRLVISHQNIRNFFTHKLNTFKPDYTAA